tara:strand:+ start:10415 stop:11197 length:783 start_codon:yes stop_codon:yes gene_type:complete
MAITVQSLIDRMRQVGLDAEGSDYYDTDIDLIPALNASIEWLVQVLSSSIGAKKFVGEELRDLVMARVFQPSSFSRIHFNTTDLGHDVWTILGIYPLPETTPATTYPLPDLTPADKSEYKSGLSHVSSVYDTSRLSIEEWSGNALNPYAPGSLKENCTELLQYAYINFADYSSTGYSTVKEIEIRPSLANKLATVMYLKMPTLITTPFASNPTQTVEFPESFANLLYEKALQFVAYKQGDNTTIYNVTANDVNVLLGVTI